MWRTITVLLLLGCGPTTFATDDVSKSREARSASDELQPARPQRKQPRRSEPTVTGTPAGPAESEPVPVENPYRVVIPGAGDGGTPVVVNPEQDRIVISGLTATADVASGRRQARVHFTANVPITHYRAVQLTDANVESPFAGVPWHPYGGGEPTVGLLGCSIHGSWAYKESIAVQLKGAPIANPNLAGQTIENISHIERVHLDVPPQIRSRFTSTLYLNPPTPQVDPIDLGYRRCPPGRTHCFIQPGSPTSSNVQVLQFHVENYPGELRTSAVKGKFGNCLMPVHAHDIVAQGDGKFRFALDVSLRGDVCMPEIVLGVCGVSDERYHTRTVPMRFERQTLVYHDSAQFSDLSFEGSCTVAQHAGDFSIATSEGTCNTSVRYGGHQRLELRWKSEQQGNCGLKAPVQLPVLPTPGGLMISAMLNVVSDFHPDYDWYPPRSVEPKMLGEAATLSPGRPHAMRQGCFGAPAKTNRVRTWIDRIDATRWQLTPVRTVR